MTPFELVEPATLGEALALLDPDDPDVRPIAGGTALILMMKSGLYRPQRLVSLRVLEGAVPLACVGAVCTSSISYSEVARWLSAFRT